MVVITKEDIEAGKPFVLKWAESPFDEEDDNYAFNPGWKQPTQVDSFYKRLEEKTSIIRDATMIQMKSLEHNLEYLRNELWFDDIRRLKDNEPAGGPKGSQIQNIFEFDESTPSFHRNSLRAANFVAYTFIPETFLKENIEKESFLPYIESDLGMRAGIEAEKIGMFGIRDPTKGKSGFNSIDGIFQQLRNIENSYTPGTDEPQGFTSSLNTGTGNVIMQMQEKMEDFINQNGRDEYAQFYVSRQLYNQILKEASLRETTKGDSVFFDGSEVRIFGTPIKRVDFLNPMRNPLKRNGWGHLALLCDPASIAWGFFNEIESKSTYEHEYLSYLTSIQCAFDTTIIWEQDVLAFDVNNTGSGDITFLVTDKTAKSTVLQGIEISIYDHELDDQHTTPIGGTVTTGADGTIILKDIPYGTYDLVAKDTTGTYKDFEEIQGMIVNNATELKYIKLTKA